MDNIQYLTSFILQQAREEADSLFDAAQEQQTAEIVEFEAQWEKVYQEKKKQLETWSDEKIKNALICKQSAIRKERIRCRQQFIDDVFLEAENQLCRLSSDQFFRFFHQSIDRLPLQGEYKVRIGEKTALAIEKLDFDALSIQKDNVSIMVDTRLIRDEGGFVLEKFPVEYSFLFRELLEDLKMQEGTAIMKKLLD